MKTVDSDSPEAISGGKAGAETSRRSSFFLVGLFFFALAIGFDCWYASRGTEQNAAGIRACQIAALQADFDSSTLEEVEFPAADLGQIIRFDASLLLSRLLKQEDLYRLQTTQKILFLLLQACLVALLTAILRSCACFYSTQHVPFRLRTILGSALPVRAGPRG